jgi:hypothetical protein
MSPHRIRYVITMALVAACQTATPTTPPPDDAAPGTLALTAQTADRIVGSYTRNHVTIGFRFEQSRESDRFVITAADGRELLSQSKSGDILVTSVFGGTATTRADLAIIRESAHQGNVPEDQRVPFDAAKAVIFDGDQDEFARFDTTAEAALMPWLSDELGNRGFNGRAYPMTVRMHVISGNIADELGLKFQTKAAYDFGDGGCLSLEGDPFGNNSYGMCGPGTTCWQSTCGDCCCHDGCKAHDWTCRNCHWYTPWNCILCGTFTSFFDGACGTSCADPVYAQPCTIGPYEQCNGRCVCTGTYDGSTEAGAAPVQWGCQQLNPGCDPSWDPNCDPNSYCTPM